MRLNFGRNFKQALTSKKLTKLLRKLLIKQKMLLKMDLVNKKMMMTGVEETIKQPKEERVLKAQHKMINTK